MSRTTRRRPAPDEPAPLTARRRRRRHRPRRPATPAPDPAAGDGGAVGARLAPLRPRGRPHRPPGRGRDTWRLSASQKRHGRSTALVMPMRSPVTMRGAPARRPAARGSRIGPSSSELSLSERPIPSAWVSLPGPEQSASSALQPAALAHQVDPVDRLERPDQHGGADALRLGHRVQQRVDAVREVHVGVAGRPEQRAAPGRDPDVGVRRRLLLVVALGLDDPAGGLAVADDAADQVARDVVHRALVERRGRSARHSAASVRTWRAWASWSRTRASDVPPSETFDSSHDAGSSSSRNDPSSCGTSSCSSSSRQLGQALAALDRGRAPARPRSRAPRGTARRAARGRPPRRWPR